MNSEERPDNFLNGDDIERAQNDRYNNEIASDVTGQQHEPTSVENEDRHTRRGRKGWFIFIAVIVVALGAIGYFRYLNPYVVDAQESGFVYNVERRGVIFKTFEGEMIADKSLRDSSHIYPRHLQFSVPDDSISRLLQQYQSRGQRVTVTYKKYSGTLPWRGASLNVVTGVNPD